MMTASEKITTPAAQVPFLPHITAEQAREFHRRVNNVRLEQVLKSIDSEERLTVTAKEEFREYTVTLTFSKPALRPYASSHLKCSTILASVEKHFFKRIAMLVKKTCNTAITFEKSRSAGREKVVRTQEGGENDDGTVPEMVPEPVDEDAMSDDGGDKADADASDERLRQRQNDENEYTGEEEEQRDVGQQDGKFVYIFITCELTVLLPFLDDDDEASVSGAKPRASEADDENSVQIEEMDDEMDVPPATVELSSLDANRIKVSNFNFFDTNKTMLLILGSFGYLEIDDEL